MDVRWQKCRYAMIVWCGTFSIRRFCWSNYKIQKDGIHNFVFSFIPSPFINNTVLLLSFYLLSASPTQNHFHWMAFYFFQLFYFISICVEFQNSNIINSFHQNLLTDSNESRTKWKTALSRTSMNMRSLCIVQAKSIKMTHQSKIN